MTINDVATTISADGKAPVVHQRLPIAAMRHFQTHAPQQIAL
jgi:hypothetical protein